MTRRQAALSVFHFVLEKARTRCRWGRTGRRQRYPKMIEAGVIALEEFSGAYASAQLVAEIYSAMVLAAPARSAAGSRVSSGDPRQEQGGEVQYL